MLGEKNLQRRRTKKIKYLQKRTGEKKRWDKRLSVKMEKNGQTKEHTEDTETTKRVAGAGAKT